MMIDRLKEIQNKIAYIHSHGEKDKMDAYDSVALLIIDLEAKEAAQSAHFGHVSFTLKDETSSTSHEDFRELENVIIHEGDISNGKKWFAISGILIEKE